MKKLVFRRNWNTFMKGELYFCSIQRKDQFWIRKYWRDKNKFIKKKLQQALRHLLVRQPKYRKLILFCGDSILFCGDYLKEIIETWLNWYLAYSQLAHLNFTLKKNLMGKSRADFSVWHRSLSCCKCDINFY